MTKTKIIKYRVLLAELHANPDFHAAYEKVQAARAACWVARGAKALRAARAASAAADAEYSAMYSTVFNAAYKEFTK